ncbi:hypothetical protein MITSMUL_05092 [Mitsuokella multacida DSM 20544]|uniref:Uncharacterized protein n=1 Tax=Mitsuokella multacida DSM 20544 TaxID=500635 RepID=C9KPD6_9FIRM|nr:hypothetical protein MITSMUL_05092 [Mitsuokella multacida DSM 20544]
MPYLHLPFPINSNIIPQIDGQHKRQNELTENSTLLVRYTSQETQKKTACLWQTAFVCP